MPEEAVEHLLLAAASEGRRWGDQLAAREGQAQARWKVMVRLNSAGREVLSRVSTALRPAPRPPTVTLTPT